MPRPAWSTALPDWERRIVAGESLIGFSPLFPAEAEAALDVFGALRVADLPGAPAMAEVSRPWVRDFVGAVFGAYDRDLGRQLITEFLLLISKKNTKSTIAAGVMLTALVRNWRDEAEFLILAPTIEVATNAFAPARGMVARDPELADLLHVQDHVRTITHLTTGATLKVIAADNEAAAGKKAGGVFVDELWLFGKKANAENMLREATGGLASRPEGFVIYASTQSDEPPAGVFREQLQYARAVRDGRKDDPKFLPVLYEFPKAMLDAEQHLEPRNFYVTNPNLGASVDVEFLEREFSKAQTKGAESLRGFLSKHLNVEIGLALASDRWAGADFWERQARPGLTLEDLLRRCEVATVGIDGGGLDDLLGLTVAGRETDTGHWLTWSRAWAHPSVLERRKEVAPRLQDFERAGELEMVKRIGDDVDAIVAIVVQVMQSGLLAEKASIGVDPHGIGGVIDALVAAGVPFEMVTGISQGWKLTGAIKTVERKLAEGALWHGGTGLMAWCVGNAKVEPRGNAVMITKQTSGAAKIDPLMALFNAGALMALNPATSGRSWWDKEPADAAA